MRQNLKKIFIFIVGGVTVLAGVFMVVLPGPALVVIPLGFAILAKEFGWAKRVLNRIKLELQKRKILPIRKVGQSD